MWVDVIDRRLHRGERHLHAAHRAFARWLHHVGAVGGGAIAGDLGIDFRAARFGVVEFFKDENAGTASDDEAVTIGVVGARRFLRHLIETRRHGAHRVEQHRERPIELLASAGEDNVLLAGLNRFETVADTMVGRGASG